MTCLSIVQNACKRLRIPVPTAVATSTDDAIIQMLQLLNAGGTALARSHDWNKLVTVSTFSGANGVQAQTGYPPGDFDRFVPTAELWDTNTKRKLVGPLDINTWTRMTFETLGANERVWTMLAGVINMLPVTATTDTFAFAWASSKWVDPVSGSDTALFALDTDLTHLDEELLTLDLVWRWKQAKGLDYAEDMVSAEMEKERLVARDGGTRRLYMARAFRNDDVLMNTYPYTLG